MAEYLDTKNFFLLSGQGTGAGTAVGTGQDTRNAANYGFLWHISYAPSSLLALQVSYDGTAWIEHQRVTATTTSAAVQVAGYLPYVRGAYLTGWAATASAIMHYTPGLK